ncbi:hypothetical protein HDV03_003987 [Kappamyces sp. JEL0829]|nr:hypothetical protein HDV03_003987 [Kappamyces sp. JEL0829]
MLSAFLQTELQIKEDGKDPSIELGKNIETLSPFLLSLDSLGCVQKLISHNAIPPSLLSHLLTCLSGSDASLAVQEVQFKILQMLLPFCTNYKEGLSRDLTTVVYGDLMASALLLCHRYSTDTKQPILANTASATFRQLVLHVFERLEEAVHPKRASANGRSSVAAPAAPSTADDAKDLGVGGGTSYVSFYEADVHALFQDLCRMLNGEPGTFLKTAQVMQKTVILELIETILASTPGLFLKAGYGSLLSMVKERICPGVIKLISEKTEFPLMVRLTRTVKTITRHCTASLPLECEVFLSLFCKILANPQYQPWQRILILECFRGLLQDWAIHRSFFETYDRADHAVNVYSFIVAAVCDTIFEAKQYLQYYSPGPASSPSLTAGEDWALGAGTASMRIQCLDQLEKADPPSFPDAYPIYLAFQSLCLVVEQQYDFIVPSINANENNVGNEVLLAIEMAKASVPSVYFALCVLATSSVDDDIFAKTLAIMTKASQVVGLLGLVPYRDAFLGCLCKIAVSPQLPSGSEFAKVPPKDIDQFVLASTATFKLVACMTDRHLQFLGCLLQIGESLVDVMDSKTWFAILDTLALAEGLVSPKGQFRRLESSSGLETGSLKPARLKSLPDVPFMEAYIAKFQVQGIDYQHQNAEYGNMAKQLYDSTAKMKPRPFMEFIRALCRLAHETLVSANTTTAVAKEKVQDEKSYAVTKLQEVFGMNIKRFVGDDSTLFDLVSGQLVNLAHLPACPGVVRTQACAVYGDLLITASQEPEFASDENVELRLVESIRALMAFEGKQGDVMVPENDTSLAKLPFLIEVRKQGLEIMYKLLQISGQSITAGWLSILEIVFLVVQSGQKRRDVASPIAVSTPADSQQDGTPSISRAAGLIRVAFPSVQLICTDFMSSLSPMGLSRMIQTVSAIGTIAEDLNISLTSVGLLWSLCDFILTKRQQLEKSGSVDGISPRPSQTSKGSLLDLSLLSAPVTLTSMDTLWMYLLRNLSELCSDYRPEVRNSANQTLFRTISTNGQRLNLDAWDLCISQVLFPLLERIKNSAPKSSDDKLWDETKILTLNGITRSLVDFLHVLVDLDDRFNEDWIVFLNYIKSTCLESSQEVATAALKSFKTLVLCASKEDLPPKVVVRVVPLWRMCFEVWFDIGKSIVAKTDEKQALLSGATEYSANTGFVWSNGETPCLLQGPFSQETLGLYFGLIFDIQPVIKPVFTKLDFVEISRMLQALLLYHSKTPPNATITKIRSDAVNDIDTMTSCQTQFLDMLTGKLAIDFAGEVKDEVALLLSDAVVYPFIPFYSLDPDELLYNSPTCKKHTYMAIAKKALTLLVGHFGKYPGLDMMRSGSLQHAMKTLSIPIEYKFGCPATSSRDPVPLWRAATSTMMTVASESIQTLEAIPDLLQQTELQEPVLAAVYDSLLFPFERLLLSSSASPHSTMSDQFLDDEKFELTALHMFHTQVLPLFGRQETDDSLLCRAITLLVRVCSYDVLPDRTPLRLPATSKNSAIMAAPKAAETPIATPVMSPLLSPLTLQQDPEIISIGPDMSSPQRERIGYYCYDTLFKLCSATSQGANAATNPGDPRFVRIAVQATSLLIARYRNQEVTIVLQGLLDLQLREQRASPEAAVTMDVVRQYLLSSSISHLYRLYPTLCQLLKVVSGFTSLANSSGGAKMADEAQIAELVLACLTRIGTCFSPVTAAVE